MWGDATLALNDSTVVRSGELGVLTYCEECLGIILKRGIGRAYSTADGFAGSITGSGNVLPGVGEPDANQMGDVCPASLRFLKEG